MATGVERMAATDASQAEPTPAQRTIGMDRLSGVLGAGGREAAGGRREAGDALIAPDQGH